MIFKWETSGAFEISSLQITNHVAAIRPSLSLSRLRDGLCCSSITFKHHETHPQRPSTSYFPTGKRSNDIYRRLRYVNASFSPRFLGGGEAFGSNNKGRSTCSRRYLRTCLLYAASFGKHCTNCASELIKLWVAEGFLKSSYPKTPEETGEECLEDLVYRNLILVVKRNTNGRINRFIMHDLIREMCVNFACSLDVAKAIPNVKKLEIFFRDDRREYQISNLVHLQKLENLNLEMHSDFPCAEKLKPTFPLKLKKLTLTGLKLPWEDLWIAGMLPELQVLKLRRTACSGDPS